MLDLFVKKPAKAGEAQVFVLYRTDMASTMAACRLFTNFTLGDYGSRFLTGHL